MWRNSQLQKSLNSAKILPTSESLSSLDIGNAFDGRNCGQFVTALVLLDLSEGSEEREQLLVGTNVGIVLLVRGIEVCGMVNLF